MTLIEIAPSPHATGRVPGGVAELVIPSAPHCVAWARTWVVRQLERAGAGDDARCVAELLTSELVTNAVRHVPAGGTITVRVDARAGSVVVAVHDESAQLPRLGRPDPDAVCGRGLPLVDELAVQWGAAREASGGKTVWFRVAA